MDNSRIASALRSLREGDLDVRLPEADPETGDVAREYNLLVEQLAEINREIGRICQEIGVQSRLGGTAEVPGAAGAWQQLLSEVNHTSRTLTIQIRGISLVASAKAAGDSDTILTAPAAGEMQELFKSLNAIGVDRQPATG